MTCIDAADTIETATCTRCGVTGPLSAFARIGQNRRVRFKCKPCRNEDARTWHAGRRTSPVARASRLTAAAKIRASAKGLPFDLDVVWVRERLERGVCEATGITFGFATERGWNTPSLDRTDARLGYTKANTRVVLFALNTACGDWGEEVFLRVAGGYLRTHPEVATQFVQAYMRALP
jgi:hypothetical protein